MSVAMSVPRSEVEAALRTAWVIALVEHNLNPSGETERKRFDAWAAYDRVYMENRP